jgi:hypothetical protein
MNAKGAAGIVVFFPSIASAIISAITTTLW